MFPVVAYYVALVSGCGHKTILGSATRCRRRSENACAPSLSGRMWIQLMRPSRPSNKALAQSRKSWSVRKASARRATPTTRAPACTKAIADLRPSPELAPVTQATRPVRSKDTSVLAICSQIKGFVGEIFCQTHICCTGVPFHAFQTGNARGCFGDPLGPFAG